MDDFASKPQKSIFFHIQEYEKLIKTPSYFNVGLFDVDNINF